MQKDLNNINVIKKINFKNIYIIIERNLNRKLTKEEKNDKLVRRLKRDSAVECRVALFKVEDLNFGGHRFKIDKNAQ